MASALFWRTFPVFALTVRQFGGGKAVRVVTALSFIPCIFAAIYLINTDVATRREFLDDMFIELIAPTLLPITTLILATGALGNELEDRTLPYLTLKPIGRLRIVWEKFIGILVVALPAILAGLVVTYLMVARGQAGDLQTILWAMLGAAAVAIVAYSAIFLAVSLVVPRALLAGIFYSFAWESALGRFVPGIRVISIRHFVNSIFVDAVDDPTVTLRNATSLTTAVITLGAASVLALILATWRLRRMNLE